MRTHGNIVKRVSQFKMLLTKRSNSVLALDKLATNRIINLKIYCTVNENVAQIFFLIGCSKQLTKQINGKTKSTMKYLYKALLQRYRFMADIYEQNNSPTI